MQTCFLGKVMVASKQVSLMVEARLVEQVATLDADLVSDLDSPGIGSIFSLGFINLFVKY
jgi:hypothetical protein